MRLFSRIALATCACVAAIPATAHEAGDWLVRFGVSNIDPKSNNHPVVSVADESGLTFNATRMITDRWSVELLAAYPYEHDIDLVAGGGQVAQTKHLPPTLGLQYHFNPTGTAQPYIGLGINYTTFFSESTEGALAGTHLSLDDSWGAALQVGVDFMLENGWLVNLNVRRIDIETDATLDGSPLGKVDISPTVVGVHLGYRF